MIEPEEGKMRDPVTGGVPENSPSAQRESGPTLALTGVASDRSFDLFAFLAPEPDA